MNNLALTLEKNIENLETHISDLENWDQSSTIIISVVKNKLPLNDSLDIHFFLALNVDEGDPLSFAGYESWKNEGFQIIRNDQLKNEIINLFEETYQKLNHVNDRVGRSFYEVTKFRHQHFTRTPFGYSIVPYDFDTLINDPLYLNWLYEIRGNRLWVLDEFKHSLAETQRVLHLIKDELI